MIMMMRVGLLAALQQWGEFEDGIRSGEMEQQGDLIAELLKVREGNQS